VTASVKTALQDEKSKHEVVIAQMAEQKNDENDVSVICTKVGIIAVARMGNPLLNMRGP
jgi:hypothetical protein